MNLILRRVERNDSGVYGELLTDRGDFLFTTLEHAYECNGEWFPKLPEGTYDCVKDIRKLSDLVPFETFEITKVPQCFGILFHVGNYNKDSDGCVLVGSGFGWSQNKQRTMITGSKQAFQKFMELQKEVDSFLLVVQNYSE